MDAAEEAQSRQKALDNVIMRMEREFSGYATNSSEHNDTDAISVGTVVSNATSLSGTNKTRRNPF